MKIVQKTPAQSGFYMPAEFDRQRGCMMIWPVRPGSWPFGGTAAKKVFAQIANTIAQGEEMYMLTDAAHASEARKMLDENVQVLVIETDDAWARDVGPTFVTNGSVVRGINWRFNAWGGTYDGLYQHWEKDDRAAAAFCETLGYDYYDAAPFVLEGGSIHSDGEGTILVTEACLLSKGRNPDLNRSQIEQKLKDYLGARKVIWLPHGIYADETNEHVDNVCAFVKPGEVVLAWCDDKTDPQYAYSMSCLEVLEHEQDAKGRKIRVHKLPVPEKPVCITPQELEGFTFEAGEDVREPGERLAASYVNFYIANESVLVPQFGDMRDENAVRILTELFPDRKVVPVYARDIIVGGGNIHCITQQIIA